MILLETLYAKVATAVIVGAVAIGLVLYVQDLRSTVASQRDTIVELRTKIKELSKPQNNQIKVSTTTVNKTVKGQETVRVIRQEVERTPNPPDCVTPKISKEAENLL